MNIIGSQANDSYELVHLEIGSQASLYFRKLLENSFVYVRRPRASLGFVFFMQDN